MSRRNFTNEKIFERLLHIKSSQSYWENIRELHSRPNMDVFARSVAFVNSGNVKKQIIGIDVLAQLGLPLRPFLKDTLELCFNLLKPEDNHMVVVALLYAIGHNNENLNNQQIEKICKCTGLQNSSIKQALVFSLLGIDNAKAIEVLITLSDDRNKNVRNWATFGLGSQIKANNQKIRDALWRRTKDKYQETKLEAILGLARRKDKKVKEIIQSELVGGEFGTLLFESILQLNDDIFLPSLREILEKSENDTSINPDWLNSLKNCIFVLSKHTY